MRSRNLVLAAARSLRPAALHSGWVRAFQPGPHGCPLPDVPSCSSSCQGRRPAGITATYERSFGREPRLLSSSSRIPLWPFFSTSAWRPLGVAGPAAAEQQPNGEASCLATTFQAQAVDEPRTVSNRISTSGSTCFTATSSAKSSSHSRSARSSTARELIRPGFPVPRWSRWSLLPQTAAILGDQLVGHRAGCDRPRVWGSYACQAIRDAMTDRAASSQKRLG